MDPVTSTHTILLSGDVVPYMYIVLIRLTCWNKFNPPLGFFRFPLHDVNSIGHNIATGKANPQC